MTLIPYIISHVVLFGCAGGYGWGQWQWGGSL